MMGQGPFILPALIYQTGRRHMPACHCKNIKFPKFQTAQPFSSGREPWQVSQEPVNMKDEVQFKASPCRICGAQSGSGTGFSTLFLPFQYYSTNAPFSPTHSSCCTPFCSNTPFQFTPLLNLQSSIFCLTPFR
jgi:hypothetical protein